MHVFANRLNTAAVLCAFSIIQKTPTIVVLAFSMVTIAAVDGLPCRPVECQPLVLSLVLTLLRHYPPKALLKGFPLLHTESLAPILRVFYRLAFSLYAGRAA